MKKTTLSILNSKETESAAESKPSLLSRIDQTHIMVCMWAGHLMPRPCTSCNGMLHHRYWCSKASRDERDGQLFPEEDDIFTHKEQKLLIRLAVASNPVLQFCRYCNGILEHRNIDCPGDILMEWPV